MNECCKEEPRKRQEDGAESRTSGRTAAVRTRGKMRIGAHADAANGTHSVSPSVSLSLPLISKTARELSHTLQVAGSEGRCGGRTKVVWRHFCHARSPSASVLGPTLSPSTPQPIPVALQCPNAMPIPIFARTRHFACSPMHEDTRILGT